MRSVLLPYLAFWLFLATGLQAQIPVLPEGTTLQTFDVQPVATEWSTAFAIGRDIEITTADELDASVNTNQASFVSSILSTTGTPNKYASARWNTNNFYLQMRPTGNAYSMLMATLQNQTGSNIAYLEISYDFAAIIDPSVIITEDIPGWHAFYSLTGQPGSWTVIPEFSTGDSGFLTAVLDLGAWPPGETIFLLWADDNGPYSDSTTTLYVEGLYTLDNFSATPLAVPPLKISISPQAQNVRQGASVTISTAVQGGTAPYTYEWFKDSTNAPLSGETGPSLTLPNAQRADSGTYFVRVTDSSSGNPQVILSAGASLSVTPTTTLTILNNADGTVTISWQPGGGTLEESTDLVDWLPSINQANGVPRSTVESQYFRVR